MIKEMQTVPVLRRFNPKHCLTEGPVMTADMQSQNSRLGRFCGFETRFIAYCLHYGIAYYIKVDLLANLKRQESRKSIYRLQYYPFL